MYNDKDKETLKTTIKAQWSLFTKTENDNVDEAVEQEESFFEFMDSTTEEHLKLMKASLANDSANTVTEIAAVEEDWIDVNDI